MSAIAPLSSDWIAASVICEALMATLSSAPSSAARVQAAPTPTSEITLRLPFSARITAISSEGASTSGDGAAARPRRSAPPDRAERGCLILVALACHAVCRADGSEGDLVLGHRSKRSVAQAWPAHRRGTSSPPRGPRSAYPSCSWQPSRGATPRPLRSAPQQIRHQASAVSQRDRPASFRSNRAPAHPNGRSWAVATSRRSPLR